MNHANEDGGNSVMAVPSVLYESEHIVAVDKPPGLLVHPDRRGEGPSLIDWIRAHYPEMEGIGEPFTLSSGEQIDRPGIVHRLDKDTSGVLLLARTQESHAHLKKQFQEHRIKKIYHAFVHGTLKEKAGEINRPIGKSRKDFRLWSAQRGASGMLREAMTRFEVLREGEDASYLKLKPQTGRTHQIRVHMKAIHHPIVCDSLYAPKQPCILGFKRLALHASGIEFEDLSDHIQTVTAPLPPDFEQALALLQEA